VTTYTIPERAQKIYNTVVNIHTWAKASDCATPLELAFQQFKGVRLDATVCIPGAGIGTYLMAAIKHGINPQNITAVELDPRYYELGSAIFERFGINYVHADFLIWNPQMQFDAVIGNPPYSLPKNGNTLAVGGKNLAMKFVEKSVSLLREGGHISMVTPYNFLKPVNSERPSQRFSVIRGVELNEVITGAERTWFPNIGTKICVWSGVKTGTETTTFSLNGTDWDLREIPFIVDLEGDALKVFQTVWGRLKQGTNTVSCVHIKDGNQLPEPGWSMTERVNRRYGKEFIIPWGGAPVREKYEQIHINITPEEAREIFSQLHVRFFVKATSIEPTVYHNLFNGLDYSPRRFTKQEQAIMTEYLETK